METIPTLHWEILHRHLPRQSPLRSPPLTTNLRHPHHLRRRRNVQDQAQFSMRLTDLNIRRITTATQFQFRFNHHHHHQQQKPFSLENDIISNFPKPMADESKKKDIQLDIAESKNEKQNESEKSKPPIPPPPEKPLPGDCCGSGCVRCVWDLYYEELEEYNKLYKAN